MRQRKNILVLFPKEWDRLELSQPEYAAGFRFLYAGFDLFRFPSNAALLTFDVRRFIDRLVRRHAGGGIDGVISNNDYFGALVAAIVAERLGLPGTSPQAVLTAQHKYYSRLRQRDIVPQATPECCVFPYTVSDPRQIGLSFPFFAKPVKATYSVLARRVDDFADLRRLLRFGAVERYLLGRLVRPFNDLIRGRPDFAIDAHHMIGERLLEGDQINVDGYVDRGRIEVLGAIDAVMYPGTRTFRRFEYPSRLPAPVLERARELVVRLIDGFGYRHGFFNVELMHDPRTGALSVIEINPRLASQLADLYRWVDGCSPYRMLLSLACGEAPHLERGSGIWGAAASFALRKFDGRPLRRDPAGREVREINGQHRDARVQLYLKRGRGLAREMKWLGSYRYAVYNLGGADRQDLHRRFLAIHRRLAYEE